MWMVNEQLAVFLKHSVMCSVKYRRGGDQPSMSDNNRPLCKSCKKGDFQNDTSEAAWCVFKDYKVLISSFSTCKNLMLT